jgi:hypothetical protein
MATFAGYTEERGSLPCCELLVETSSLGVDSVPRTR